MTRRTSSVLVVLCVLGARPLFAQNLLLNPHFDTDLSNWTTGGSIFDGTRDANGSPTSGSARATVNIPTPFVSTATGPKQCVNGITAGATYDFGGKLLIESAPVGGTVDIDVIWFNTNGCTGFISLNLGTFAAAIGLWTTSQGTAIAPAGAVAATIQEVQRADATPGTFTMNFDDMFLQPSTSVPIIPWFWLALLALGMTMAGALALKQRRVAHLGVPFP